MIIKKVKYQLTKDGEWKEGLSIECIGNMKDSVIDADGNLLDKDRLGCSVYNIKDCLFDLCINLDTIIK